MANLFARATANWASANWNTAADGSGSGATPGAGDVCMANGFTVTINANVTVGEIRNDTMGGATAGGQYLLSSGITYTGNIFAGNASCLTFSGSSPNQAYIVGNLTGGSSAGAAATSNSGTGTLNITGNVSGGSAGTATATGVTNGSSGTVNITGNATGNTGRGASNSSTGTINVTGNVLASGTGVGAGVYNAGAGTITVAGYAQSSDYGPGSSGVTLAYGAENLAQGIIQIAEGKVGARGLGAVSGAFRYSSTATAKSIVRATSGLTEVVLRPIAAVVPAAPDVKNGVVYGDGGYTGTLASSGGNTNMSGHFS